MKYRDKELPLRDVYVQAPHLSGNDEVMMTLTYETKGPNSRTFTRQPITISLCQMRNLGRQFHVVLDELEDMLHEARNTMKGTR